MQNSTVHIFCDFDGTITTSDVGVLLLDRFSRNKNWRDVEEDMKSGKITIREVMQTEYSMFRGTKQEVINEIMPQISIDKGFKSFVDYIENKYPLTILSDGFEFYIKRILQLGNIPESIEIITNKVKEKDRRFELVYPNPPCEHGCANCKTSHVLKAKKENNSFTIYIGDGLSDWTASRHADLTFARKGSNLERFCIQNNTTHMAFDDFYEILEWFRTNN